MMGKYVEEQYSYKVFEISTYFDLYVYHNFTEWPILNIELFEMFKKLGYSFYVAERFDFESICKYKGSSFPFDEYGLSLLFIMLNAGKIESVYSRWNKDDITHKYISLIQLMNLLEENFYKLIDNDKYRFKPHYDLTGIKGIIKVYQNFGFDYPVLLFEYKNKKGFMVISDNPEFVDYTFSKIVPKPISNKLKRWIILNKEGLMKYWNREINNFFGMHKLQTL